MIINTRKSNPIRILITFLIFGLTINLSAQNFKKILSKTEIDSIKKGFTIYKSIDKTNCRDFDDFQGKIMISKSNSEYDWNFVGSSSKYDTHGRLKAQFSSDSIGRMTTYQEFDDNGKIVYDCTYDYKMIKNCQYLLEHIKLYYLTDLIREDGWRCLKISDENGKVYKHSSYRKFGKWIYYFYDGTIEKTKDYGEIK